jgi:hypothetical protein
MFPANFDIVATVGTSLDIPLRFRHANKDSVNLSGYNISFGVANTVVYSNGVPGSTSCGSEGNVHIFSDSVFTTTAGNTYSLVATDNTNSTVSFLLATGMFYVAPGSEDGRNWFLYGTWDDNTTTSGWEDTGSWDDTIVV